MSFYIIETPEQLSKLKFDRKNPHFVYFIPFNYNYHYMINDNISLIYVKEIIDNSKGYMLCINHNESLNKLNIKHYENWQGENGQLIKLHNKGIEILSIGKFGFDLSIEQNNIIEINNTCIDTFYKQNPSLFNLNCIIPISKHYEYCEKLYDLNIGKRRIFETKRVSPYYAVCEVFETLTKIEYQGIRIAQDKFQHYFPNIKHPEFNIKDGKIYTQYNVLTTTGRPSNSFNEINFSALNKENGERSIIIPENDILVEFDINAYHPRLAAKLCSMGTVTNGNFYDHLGVPKEEVFQNLYGHINRKLAEQNTFFHNVQRYINDTWDTFQRLGYYETKLRRFTYEKFPDMTPNKLFNYILQSEETYVSSNIIKDIQLILKNTKSKLIMYTYDSFLIDCDISEGKIIDKIKEYIKFPTNIKAGFDYHNMYKF